MLTFGTRGVVLVGGEVRTLRSSRPFREDVEVMRLVKTRPRVVSPISCNVTSKNMGHVKGNWPQFKTFYGSRKK